MPTSNLFTAKQFANLASKQVGKQYILGQPIPYNKPNPSALDCSGLLVWLFNQSGAYPMGDDTAAGLYNRTKAVTGAPAVGDLVFLRNNPARSNGIGHVAILTSKLSNGDWRIVEARGRTAGVVNTTLSYWKTRKYYTGVRRIPSFRLLPESTSPVEPDPSPKKTKFDVGFYNALDTRFGGKEKDDGTIINKLASSITLLVEAPSKVRDYIRTQRGGKDKFLVWTRSDDKSQAIMFEKKKWKHTNKDQITFGPTSYHGAVWAVLTRVDTGLKVQFGAGHLPPTKVYSSTAKAESERKRFFDSFMKKLDLRLPTVIGFDANTPSIEQWAKEYGFKALKTGATTDSGKRLDWLFTNTGSWSNSKTLDPGASSDHKAIKGTVTFVSGSSL